MKKEEQKPQAKAAVKPQAQGKPQVQAQGKAQQPPVAHRKSNLSKPQKKHFYDLLMAARNEFMEQVKFHTDEALTSQKDSAGERAGMATHMADLGSDNSRHDLELGLLSEEVDVIEMIEDSLQRLEDDEYGICVDCSCDIAVERLEAKPYARFCTRCKSRHEAREDVSRRRSR